MPIRVRDERGVSEPRDASGGHVGPTASIRRSVGLVRLMEQIPPASDLAYARSDPYGRRSNGWLQIRTSVANAGGSIHVG